MLEKDNPYLASRIPGIWHYLFAKWNKTAEMRRDARSSTIPNQSQERFKNLNNHTSGTDSLNGAMDYPRYSILEIHLGKYPESTEFQGWKVNIKTEICANSQYLHITMQWFTEVEIAKSMGDLMTSRSIAGRTDFSDYDLLDAKIASALK